MTSSIRQVTTELALKQHNARLTALERSDGSGRWVAVNPEGGPDTDPEGPEFQNGWANVGGQAPVAFKRYDNWVHIRGAFSGGTDGTIVFTLPEEYWPIFPVIQTGAFADGSGTFTFSIDVSGNVTYITGAAY